MNQPRVETQAVAPGVSRISLTDRDGWGWNTVVVSGPSGAVVYSPAWFGRGTFERIEEVATPRALVAPNHFHHLALSRYREHYPQAVAACSEGARPRLTRQGHQGLQLTSAAEPFLPPGARFWTPPGLKTGEVWLGVPTSEGVVLLVGDAVFNPLALGGFKGAVLRALATGPGISVGRTYRWLAVSDRSTYVSWCAQLLEELEPSWVVPCHGEPFPAGEPVQRWREENRRRLG